MKKLLLFIAFFIFCKGLSAQTGKDFWFAPPDITDLHNSPGGEPIYLLISSTGTAATVTISQPANATFNGGTPITVSVAANASKRINLTSFKSILETRPTNAIVNTGLKISSTNPVTVYYEIANTNNTDIFALKGDNALGNEFYIPLHKYAPFYNNPFASPHQAFASFDIIATQNNTVISIYSPTPVDGHAALQQFSITLNAGQTYSCGFTGTNYTDPSTHPGGAVVLSDKPIAITIKDDSDHNPSGGCYDLLGDQIVPVSVLGTEYIAVKGQLNSNGDESVFITSTQNNTKVYFNGSSTASATLFAGEIYRYDMDYLASGPDKSVYISTSKPAYVTHVTGFGCEMGMALLPQLGCAGSRQVSFVRSSSEGFFLTLLVKATAVNNFSITGSGTAAINPASFLTVPGTGGVWKSAIIQYNTTEIPVDSTFRISNSADVFAMGIINGGTSTGCRYGYFSEYASTVFVDAGADQNICANTTIQLNGSVAGGAIAGIWTTNGSGTFNPSNTALTAVYTPSAADTTLGNIRFILTSTGSCAAKSDTMLIHFTAAPVVRAGTNINSCGRDSIQLSGVVYGGAVTGLWSSTGTGTFYPNAATLTGKYIPSAADEIAGTFRLKLISTSNGTCNAVSDSITVNLTRYISVASGSDTTLCANNGNLQLHGTVSGGSATGQWTTGGNGVFSPSSGNLNAVYIPSSNDTAAGIISIYLTSTNNGFCSARKDTLVITYNDAPLVSAGTAINSCSRDTVQLNGSIGGGSVSATWTTNGSGSFIPNANTLIGKYVPSASDELSGSVKLYLTSNSGGNCTAVRDSIVLSITRSISVNAGSDTVLCGNNANLQLHGLISGGTASGQWTSTGNGVFSPLSINLNAIYQTSSNDTSAGNISLILSSTNNGFCPVRRDTLSITYSNVPVVNAGPAINSCGRDTIQLSGTIGGGASSATWSTSGSGSFIPNANTLIGKYVPSASDELSGSVKLYLTSNSGGNCTAVRDSIVLSITRSISVNAGSDTVLCGNNANLQLHGLISGGTASGQWMSTGNGVFSPLSTNLNAIYQTSSNDTSAGNISLILSSTNNGFCPVRRDTLSITYSNVPVVNAGSAINSCGRDTIQLSGTIGGGASSATWSTSGSGSFYPNANALNGKYVPSAADESSGIIRLKLTTNSSGNCLAVSDSILISITRSISINAGSDNILCANNANHQLHGLISGGTTSGIWTSSGTGIFSPAVNNLNAVYIPSSNDTAAGSVSIILTSTSNGFCAAKKDSLILTYTDAPLVNAGSAVNSCGRDSIQLNGTIGGGSISATWSTSGSGSFIPNANTLNAKYFSSVTDENNGSVQLNLIANAASNCSVVKDSIQINITKHIVLNAGSDTVLCANNANLQLHGLISGGTITGQWSTDGNGLFLPSINNLNSVYQPTSNDTASGSINIILTSTNNGFCAVSKDTIRVVYSDAPDVVAGSNISVCANYPNAQLSGYAANATSITWTSSGTGTFNPDNHTLNAVYMGSADDISNGQVLLKLISAGPVLCNADSDSLSVSFTPAPVVQAGSDVTLCVNNLSVNLNALVGGGTNTALWSSNGTGTFFPDANSLSAIYQLSSADSVSGAVRLILSSTNNGNCIVVKDTLDITVVPAGRVNAGTDLFYCANANPQFNGFLNGSVTIATWSSTGSGYFTPSVNDLNATYVQSAADTSTGFVYIILSGNSCENPVDSLRLTFTPAPLVEAGNSQNICGRDSVYLTGTISGGANTGLWSTNGDGIFKPNAATLNAVYIPGINDVASGNVLLTLSSTNNGSCIEVSDSLSLSITASININAGSDAGVCANNPDYTVHGLISGGTTTGQWTSSGNGYFSPNSNNLNATYIATANDTASGSVYLNLTSTNNGNCAVKRDSILLTFADAPVIDAGSNISVCANNAIVNLNASAYNTTNVSWTTSGTGTFSPNNGSLNAIYNASIADINSGFVILKLTSSNPVSCLPVSDSLNVSFTAAPNVYAGADTILCIGNLDFQLNGFVTGPSNTGIWISTGTGTFIPDANTLNAVYHASKADSIAGSYKLILSSTNIGSCNIVRDTILVNFTQKGITNAGTDKTICANGIISLTGTVSGTATAASWSSSGSGNFIPFVDSLNVTYQQSNADTTNGFVYLLLTGNSCEHPVDSVKITFSPAPLVNAGSNFSICANNALAQLNGSVSNAGGALWSGGSGSFNPSNTDVNAVYTPSSSEIINGNFTLTLTSANNGTCSAISDDVTITITAAPVVNAGIDREFCKLTPSFQLQGAISGATTFGEWTSLGSGSFSPSNNIMNCFYTFSPTDTANSSIKLVLTSTTNGNCLAVTDTVVISLQDEVKLNAGPDLYVCAKHLQTVLSGYSSAGLYSAKWSTSGTGYFVPNDSVLNSSYVVSHDDSIAGTVSIVLRSVKNGLCPANSDTMKIFIQYEHQVNAGADIIKCPNTDPVSLVGSVVNSTGGKWKTSGTGTFSPSDTSLLAYYIPSAADTALTVIYLSLTSKDNGGCAITSDTLLLKMDDLLQASFTATNACEDKLQSFSDLSSLPNGNLNYWFWNFGDGSTSLQQNPDHAFDQTGTYQVTLQVKSDNGCVDQIAHTVNVYATPLAGFTSNSPSYFPGEPVNFIHTGSGYVNTFWNFGDSAAISNSENPIHTYLQAGTYHVIQVVNNQFGCVDSIKEDIVIENDEVSVYGPVLPTAFSPNYDNNNDILYVRGGPFKQLSFTVYDEWGHEIFTSTDSDKGWDGTSANKALPLGVYIYTVKAITIKDQPYNIHGEVKLMR